MQKKSSEKMPDIAAAGIPGIAVGRLLGRGRQGVYQLGRHRAIKPVEAAEKRLSAWAAARGVGPAVFHSAEGILCMQRMSGTLSNLQLPLAEAKHYWALAFELLSSDLSTQNGYLVGDDIKPSNILYSAQEGPRVVLADWDPVHWRSLPIAPADGKELNRCVLILNSLAGQRDTSERLRLFGLWPDAVLEQLSALCQLEARYIERFARALDPLLRAGCYHYAAISAPSASGRARCLAQLLHDSAPQLPALPAQRLRRWRHRFLRLARRFVLTHSTCRDSQCMS